jgi:transposase
LGHGKNSGAKTAGKDYRRIGYRTVRSIAIDELYLGRTHKYVTLVIDLESGRIIWVEQGRGSQALREFWRRFKLSGARLKAVAMDMSGAYAASVRAHAPHAIVTFDRFHLIKLMNQRLDNLRRELAREAHDHNAKQAIKGLRWPLLHRRDNLEKDAARRLERSLALNEPLQCAYLLKEELGELWEQKDGREAWGFLREWCAEAKASGIRQLHAMAQTLLRHPHNARSDCCGFPAGRLASDEGAFRLSTRVSDSFNPIGKGMSLLRVVISNWECSTTRP